MTYIYIYIYTHTHTHTYIYIYSPMLVYSPRNVTPSSWCRVPLLRYFMPPTCWLGHLQYLLPSQNEVKRSFSRLVCRWSACLPGDPPIIISFLGKWASRRQEVVPSGRPPCPHSSALSGSVGLLAHALCPCGIHLRVISCSSWESDVSDIDKSSCTLRHLHNLEDLVVIFRSTRIDIPKLFLMFTQCVYVFCVALRANSTDQELNDFYNRDGVCLLRGTNCTFK